MQGLTDGPRAGMNPSDVLYLIQGAGAVTVGAGCELLSPQLEVLGDLSSELLGGSVTRQGYATLHGSAELALTAHLDWGTAILRPHYTIRVGDLSARFNLGAYLTSVPTREVGTSTPSFDVTGFDILHWLNTPVGDSYAVEEGVGYLDAIKEILDAQGLQYVIQEDASTETLPSPRVWPLADKVTWLTIVNDLLGAVGYRGLYSDPDGRLRAERYLAPRDRGPEWTYDTDPSYGMLGQRRGEELDLFEAPNRWVFVRSNNVDGDAPVAGNGVYTVDNFTNGPTSQQARGGRVITTIRDLDVADHASLVTAGDAIVEAEMSLSRKRDLTTAPNPLHWHFDRMLVDDPELGGYFDVLCTKWTLPLNGDDMDHEWTVL